MNGTAKLIGRANGVKHLHSSNGNTTDIINTIMYADKFCAPYTVNAAITLQGRNLEETCYNVWKFWKENVQYVEDPDGHQYIQSPGYLIETGKGDCKSYSVAVASMLQNLGIKYFYRFITEDASKDFHHVYVVVPTPQGEIYLDCVLDEFNKQNAFALKKDVAPQHKGKVGRIGATQAETTAATWVQFEKSFKDNLADTILKTRDLCIRDMEDKYAGRAVKRAAAVRAIKENFNVFVTSSNCLLYNFWDDSKAAIPEYNQITQEYVFAKRTAGRAYEETLREMGLRGPAIYNMANLACYNTYGITLNYMLYRCYNMVNFGQPWEPVAGVPYYDFRTDSMKMIGGFNTAEQVAMAVEIGSCFPAAGGIARPFGVPYLSVGKYYIQNGATDAVFADYKKNYVPSQNEINRIYNRGQGIPQDKFAANYALYLKWLNGNMAALPSPGTVGNGKPAMGGAKVGELTTTVIVAIVGAIVAVLSLISGIVFKILEVTKRMPAPGQIPCPPLDFNYEYTSVDGCYIGTAPAECGALAAKYCPNGTFTCLTVEDLKRPENQPGTPKDGFAGFGSNSFLLMAGGVLLLLGLFFSGNSKD